MLTHWSLDPFLGLIAVLLVVHGRGLALRLRAIQRSGRSTTRWLQQAVLFWTGLLVLSVAVVSPIDYWTDTYLTAHVVQHILLAFIAPPLIVLGAPWLPLLRGLPRPVARAFGRLLQFSARRPPVPARPADVPPVPRMPSRVLSRVRSVAARPVTAVVAFNAAMLFWHLPAAFDAAQSNQVVHIWLEHGCFFALGVCLWLQVFGSYPFRPVLAPPGRVLVLVASNAVMVIIAMTMVMFSKNLYPWYAGRGLAAQAADQQIAGAILWVCGEVTFLPSILVTVTRWLAVDEHPGPGRAANLTGPSRVGPAS